MKTENSAGKVWFITGASRGFGRIWAEAALKRGDKVAATARSLASVAELANQYSKSVLPLALDVTNPEQVKEAVAQAHAHFGKLDIVINNAGFALTGAIEEASEAQIRAQFETNFYGALRVIRAVLPIMREQGHGHILGVSSGAGLYASPISGYYSASKFALEAVHESLAQEVGGFGIKVTILEPGMYATEFGRVSTQIAPSMDAYNDFKMHIFSSYNNVEQGDPQATAGAILKIVDAENSPLRFFLGNDQFPVVCEIYKNRIATWEEWKDVSNEAQGELSKIKSMDV